MLLLLSSLLLLLLLSFMLLCWRVHSGKHANGCALVLFVQSPEATIQQLVLAEARCSVCIDLAWLMN